MHTSYNIAFKWSSCQICPTLASKQDISNVPFFFVFVARFLSSVLLITSKQWCFFLLLLLLHFWLWLSICCTHHKNNVKRVMESLYQMLVTYVYRAQCSQLVSSIQYSVDKSAIKQIALNYDTKSAPWFCVLYRCLVFSFRIHFKEQKTTHKYNLRWTFNIQYQHG